MSLVLATETETFRNIFVLHNRDSQTSTDSDRRKKSIVVGLKSKNGTAVEHVLLEDLLASI